MGNRVPIVVIVLGVFVTSSVIVTHDDPRFFVHLQGGTLSHVDDPHPIDKEDSIVDAKHPR